MEASLSNTECTIYALILPHSPSDITPLHKIKGQKDHMNTFQSALNQCCAICIRIIGVYNGWCFTTCSTGILHQIRDLL